MSWSRELKTGHDQAFLVSYPPAFDETGEVVGISVAVIDITARKRTEAALRDSEDHYRLMVELNPQIPWMLEDKGMATMISPRSRQTTGMSEEYYRGRGFISALHPADQRRVVETIEHSLRTGDRSMWNAASGPRAETGAGSDWVGAGDGTDGEQAWLRQRWRRFL